MTATDSNAPATDATEPEPTNTDTETPPAQTQDARLPDDHPAALALAKANKEAEALRKRVKEFEDRDKSEHDKLTERATTAEVKATEAEARYQRLKIGIAKGLPPDLAERLAGTNEQELEADADRLIASLEGTRAAPAKPPSFDAGAKGGQADSATDMNALLRGRAGANTQ